MLTYIIRRLLLLVPTLLGVTAVVFFVMGLAPGGFSGVVLSQHGTQTEGEEAKRIRNYFNRRYGLDQPLVVQYGRWLNKVSPVGFRTSSQVQFSDEQKTEVADLLAASEAAASIKRDRQIRAVTLALARHLDVEPAQAARQMIAAMDRPDAGLELIDRLGALDPGALDKKRGSPDDDAKAARKRVLNMIDAELAGRDRVLFHRPAIKLPDLGESLRGRPVMQLLAEHVPVTILLNAITVPFIYTVAIVGGVFAARHRGKLFDVGSGGAMLFLWSIPAMWVGVMFIGFLANKQYIQLFPVGGLHDMHADQMSFFPSFGASGFERGWLLDTVWHLILPVFCLTYGAFAVLAKLTRAAMLENLSSDFVRTARAKGVSERDVLFRHVFRNSMLPLITVFIAILPGLFAGSVIVETIFSIRGMGKLSIEAAFMKDREVVMGTTLVGAIIGLLSLLVRDIWYAMADPRVSYE